VSYVVLGIKLVVNKITRKQGGFLCCCLYDKNKSKKFRTTLFRHFNTTKQGFF